MTVTRHATACRSCGHVPGTSGTTCLGCNCELHRCLNGQTGGHCKTCPSQNGMAWHCSCEGPHCGEYCDGGWVPLAATSAAASS